MLPQLPQLKCGRLREVRRKPSAAVVTYIYVTAAGSSDVTMLTAEGHGSEKKNKRK